MEIRHHAISGPIARGLFGVRSFGRWRGGRGPSTRGPAAVVAGCGPGRHGPRLGGEDRRHGPPDAARLGASLQSRRVRRASSTTGRRAPSPACRRSNWPSSRRSSRSGWPGPCRSTAWCAGGAIDLKRVIAERFGVDFHPRYVGKVLQKLEASSHMSAQAAATRRRTNGSSRRLKKFPARAEGSSRRPAGDDAGRDMV